MTPLNISYNTTCTDQLLKCMHVVRASRKRPPGVDGMWLWTLMPWRVPELHNRKLSRPGDNAYCYLPGGETGGCCPAAPFVTRETTVALSQCSAAAASTAFRLVCAGGERLKSCVCFGVLFFTTHDRPHSQNDLDGRQGCSSERRSDFTPSSWLATGVPFPNHAGRRIRSMLSNLYQIQLSAVGQAGPQHLLIVLACIRQGLSSPRPV